MQTPGLATTLLAFALVIGPLVFVHEMGHYLVGRWCGVKADIFSVGFGREIAGYTDRRGTRWKVGWLPLGGYVKFAGDMNPAGQPSAEWLAMPAAERRRTFQARPLWQRAATVAAGPAVNFLVAMLILGGFALAYGDVRVPPVAASVASGSAAAAAGIVPGDRIVTIGGRAVDTFGDLVRYVQIRPGERVGMAVEHAGRRRRVDVVIGTDAQVDRFGNRFEIGRLGIGSGDASVVPVGLLQAPVVALRRTGDIVQLMVETLGQVVTGRRSIKEMGGPLSIARISGQQMSLGPDAFVALIALVSVNLGFINLLPVPMLDGGHLLFYAIEAVRRKPVDATVQEWAFRGGLAAILALMLVVTFNDLGNMGLWRGLGRGLAGLIG